MGIQLNQIWPEIVIGLKVSQQRYRKGLPSIRLCMGELMDFYYFITFP